MRTLAVDALRLVGNRTAMGRYLEYLAVHWNAIDVPFDRIVFITPANVSPRDLGVEGAQKIVVRSAGRRLPLLVWEQGYLPLLARGAAALFCPSYTCPLGFQGPLVLANHGIYERIPGEFSQWQRLRTIPLFKLGALRADRVIANSQATRDDLERFFRVSKDKIDVIYPAARELFFETHEPYSIDAEVARTLGAKVPYLLFVGKLSRRRNVPTLLKAFANLRAEGSILQHLLIVGPNTTDLPIEKLAREGGVADFVHYLPHLDHDRLAKLYAGADAFVLPTSFEGISWTMFEAMASGAPVLTIAHPTAEEGCKDAVFTVPSASVEDVARGLRTLLTDADLRARYKRLGREQAARFSWRETARETLRVIDRVALPADRRSIST